MKLEYACARQRATAVVIGSAKYYPRTFSSRLQSWLRLIFTDTRHFAQRVGNTGCTKVTLDSYLQDLKQLHGHLGLGKTILFGHSHHGNLAVEYALKYPEDVSHVVLLGSTPESAETTIVAARRHWNENASADRKSLLNKRMAELRAREPQPRSPAEAYVAKYVAESPKYWHEPTFDASHLWKGVPVNLDLIKTFRSFFSGNYCLRTRLNNLEAPILVVMGKSDYAVPAVLWEDIRTNCDNLSYHLFDRSGHTPQLEQPGEFEKALISWLDPLAPRPRNPIR